MKFLEAVLMLSGMIIGVGMFAIPFSFAKAGFFLGTVELVILTGLTLVTHLIYGEVILATKEPHRMPGYVRLYLGRRFAALAWLSAIFGMGGTLLAYLAVGATFLNHSFLPVASLPQWVFALVLAVAVACITYFPLRKEALWNGIFTTLLIGFLVFLVVMLLPAVSLRSFVRINTEHLFLPYGVLLFALSGGVAIPDVIALLGRDRRRSRFAIVAGTLIPAVLYFFFALVVVGVSGDGTTEEAIQGLVGIASSHIVLLGNIVGLLAVFTSFLVLAANAQALLRFDFSVSRSRAWLLVSTIPALLYFIGFQSFITVIAVVGAVSVGIDSALLLVTHHAFQKKVGRTLSWFSILWRVAIYVMIALGIIYQLPF